jgi:hypothetical protein
MQNTHETLRKAESENEGLLLKRNGYDDWSLCTVCRFFFCPSPPVVSQSVSQSVSHQ